MTVAELIEFLKTKPQDIPVCFCQYSDYSILTTEHISVGNLQMSRGDGYVGGSRPDKPLQQWLIFPGN